MKNEIDFVVPTIDSSLVEVNNEEVHKNYNMNLKSLIMTNNPKIFGLLGTKKVETLVLKNWDIDTKELLIEGKKINAMDPCISKKSLAIKLLTIVANNKKYRNMSKIASEMLAEGWWVR